jgi:hypothetical protein
MQESSAEPFVPNTYIRDVTFEGRPSRKEIRPTSEVRTTLRMNMTMAATAPYAQPA